MAKKAQANAKSSAKPGVKALGKSGASTSSGSAKKPGKASASAKAPAVKVAAKAAPAAKAVKGKSPAKVAEPKKAAAAPVEKKSVVAPPAEVAKKSEGSKKPAGKASADKASQAAETSEKIKIDKSMTEDQAKWAEMYNKYRDADTTDYNMRSTFTAASAIQHKVLGWGWIVSNENDRLEVLFKDGKRMLISNYKG